MTAKTDDLLCMVEIGDLDCNPLWWVLPALAAQFTRVYQHHHRLPPQPPRPPHIDLLRQVCREVVVHDGAQSRFVGFSLSFRPSIFLGFFFPSSPDSICYEAVPPSSSLGPPMVLPIPLNPYLGVRCIIGCCVTRHLASPVSRSFTMPTVRRCVKL